MADPFRHVQRGDRLDIPAETFNTLIDLARDSRGQSALTGAMQQAFGSRAPQLIRMKNNTANDYQRFELVGISNFWSPDQHLESTAACVGYVTAPSYSRWGVAQEPLPAGATGLVAVNGLALAKIVDRDVQPATPYADVHPDPTPETREGFRLCPRTHGYARIVRSWYQPLDWDCNGAIVDLGNRRAVVSATLAETTQVPGSNTVWPDGDSDDPLNVVGVAGVGANHSTTDATRGSLVLVNPGGYSGSWTPVGWPTEFWVLSQEEIDDDNLLAHRYISVKFATYNDSGWLEHGEAFNAYLHPFSYAQYPYLVDRYGFATAPPYGDWGKTLRVRRGQRMRYCLHVGEPWYGYLAEEPGIYDEPWGTIRPIANPTFFFNGSFTTTGPSPGWYWCDGQSHPDAPDLRDRFLIGAGPGPDQGPTKVHTFRGTGGQSHHGRWGDYGPDFNSHNAHQLPDHTFNVDYFEAPVHGGTAAMTSPTVVGHGDPSSPGVNHSMTDNEPPWYGVVYAIRLPPAA